MADDQEFVEEIQDRDESFISYLKSNKERRGARVVMHEKIALFSAGTLSLMLTLAITQNGAAEIVAGGGRILFVGALSCFLVSMIASLFIRIITANEFYFLYCDSWLSKEERLIKVKHRRVMNDERQSRRRGQVRGWHERELSHLAYGIRRLGRDRKMTASRVVVYGYAQKTMVLLSISAFLAACGLAATFVVNLVMIK